MRRLFGVLTMVLALGASSAFATAASGETIRVDVDGDKARDPVVASVPAAGTMRVATLLSSRSDKFTFVDLPGSGAPKPYIAAKGDVNRGKGAELFVRSGRNKVADTVSVLTVARGDLINARSFFVNSALGDGLAMGIRCGTVKGGPGIRSYVFRLGNKGRWTRFVTPYGWKKGRLVRMGKKTKGKVKLPRPEETGLGCPKPKPIKPPEPPPVLGSSGNRFLKGLGRVEPKSFSARAGTGRYFGFKWKGWKRPRATARGFFNAGGPGDTTKRMNLTAFDLGKCAGRATYRKLTMKPRGQNGITLNVC